MYRSTGFKQRGVLALPDIDVRTIMVDGTKTRRKEYILQFSLPDKIPSGASNSIDVGVTDEVGMYTYRMEDATK